MRYIPLLVLLLSGCSHRRTFHQGYLRGYSASDRLLNDQSVEPEDAGFIKGIMDRARLYQLEEKRLKL